MSVCIPSKIRDQLKSRFRRKATAAFVKLFLIWAALGAFCYFAANDVGGKFNPTTMPYAFWSIVAVVAVVPPVVLRIWQYLGPFETHGTVERTKDCLMNIQTKRNTGRVRSFRGGWDMWNVDTCEVLWRSDRGALHSKNISLPERAEMARAYYHQGDRLIVYRGAAVPFNENRLPVHPLCIACGNVAKDHEVRCPQCGVTLLQERTEENEIIDEAGKSV